jgi:hypothetical protein
MGLLMKKIIIGSIVAGACIVSAALVSRAQTGGGRTARGQAVTVYKTATCGCCAKWVDHMRAAGFDVKTTDVENIGEVKSTYGVPGELSSCHTSLVAGYVVEGHVPADVVSRMLREKPKIAGIAVPGMPIGSPGMEQGGQRNPYQIIAFERGGKASVYERR